MQSEASLGCQSRYYTHNYLLTYGWTLHTSMWPKWWHAYLWVTTITNKYMRVLSQPNIRVLSTAWPHMSDRSSRSDTRGVETIFHIYTTRMIQMKIQARVHGHKGLRHHIREFWHKIWSVTQSRLIGVTSSKMTNQTTVLKYMFRLLQCSSIIIKWVFYSEVRATKPVDPQTLYIACTAMDSYKKHINSKNMMHRTSVWNLTTRK